MKLITHINGMVGLIEDSQYEIINRTLVLPLSCWGKVLGVVLNWGYRGPDS